VTIPVPLPFRLRIPDATLEALRRRLSDSRWPDPIASADARHGMQPSVLRPLMEHWAHGFDWRAAEAELNAFDQFRVRLDGQLLHFIHQQGRGTAPLPLLICHGWPGSIVELKRLIGLLTDPQAHGADARDSFSVVAPSLPGYTLSYEPGQARLGVAEMAELFVTLMRDVLGYAQFGAQGGDWGAFITSRIALMHPQLVRGLHLNYLPLRGDPRRLPQPSAEELRYADELQKFVREEAGYQAIQGTRPDTLAFALTDSPVGLAAWILEKFQVWSDCDGDLTRSFRREDLLTNLTLYWTSGAIGSSFAPYYALQHAGFPWPRDARIQVPTGYAEFPREILRPPRSLAARQYTDIQRWTRMPRGGHFAALEQPEALAEEIRAFFRPLRA
jgi:pimeloyl-ACP methyl ester carboxylesterase